MSNLRIRFHPTIATLGKGSKLPLLSLIAIITIFLCGFLPVQAQDSLRYKVSTHAFSVGGGLASTYDTYLSPLYYRGWQADILYEGYKEKPKSAFTALSQQWMVHIYGGEGRPSHQASQAVFAHIQGFWAMYAKWNIVAPLNLELGGLASFRGGGLYNLRNGNNPASANVGMDAQVSMMLNYRFKIKKQVFSLRYRLSIPLLGVAFAPPYGASYYEMFMIRSVPISKYIVATSLHNTWAFENQLSLDFHLPNTILRLSYLGQSHWSSIHNIEQSAHFHSFQFGVVYNLINISGTKAAKPADMWKIYDSGTEQ